ncbi:MAG: NAD-dependent DNA ligase LigA [Amoebophilaceae bacterium]|nr:NAD-dependent DNA ligase LigA [Amoebophilaceae bacterium]
MQTHRQLLEIGKEIQRLVDLINYHNQCYFEKGAAEISDYAYDQLLERLTALEQAYPDLKLPASPTEKLGEYPSKAFATAYHQFPMLSLAKTYSEAEIVRFVTKAKQSDQAVTFICELKIDGVALSLVYEQGKLQRIVTRGDGEQGDNITKNGNLLFNFPEKIPAYPYVEIRGEAFMSHQTFDRLNKLRIENNDLLWANPRNITAGTLKALAIADIKERKLDFYAYSLHSQPHPCQTQEASLQLLTDLGFSIAPTYKVCHDATAIIDYIHYWADHKEQLPVGIDGIVIKVNHLAQQEAMGSTAKSPRWAIAYKYKPKIAHSILENVTFQVGRTGMITPVAHFHPIPLAGTRVQRASLHNANELAKKDLHLGDTIFIEKGGDIIPQVVGVDFTKRGPQTIPILFTTVCPGCATPLVKDEEEVAYFCPNRQQCPPQLKEKLVHFAHRKAMDITCLGPQTIHALFEAKLVNTIADLYSLDAMAMSPLAGFQAVSRQKLLSNIHLSKTKPFEKVLFALGIKHIGATVAKKLALHFKSIAGLQCATQAALLAVPDVGIKIVESIVDYFNDPYEQEILQKLQQAGLQFSIIENKENKVSTFDLFPNKFVISGSFHQITREALAQRIEAAGGQLLSTISPKVTFLVVGEKPGASKLAKAAALAIPILQEEDIMKMIAL